ncbi:SAM-dependent methyltransferase [Crossiella equi]|uniref:SAM-dependent methyltransferase n=1 Tax=Crossiella equi TaxID=130796 RepID=A0ABS5AT32_9PSEU|nr:class I SAM-dependent methyltransferase [Crossiella equi]MBP2479718.1 SAM-dependent methyltransferase [Crossiella equi]
MNARRADALIDYAAFGSTGAPEEDTVVAAHELYSTLIGLWAPAIIEAAAELGVYPLLRDEPVGSDEIAAELALDPAAVRILLDGLHACGMLRRGLTGGGVPRYRLEDRFAPLLLGTGEYHLLGKMAYDRTVAWPAWRGLAETIRSGGVAPGALPEKNQNSERDFVSLVSGINFWAPHAIESVRTALRADLGWDLARPTSVLDVGCGTGIYSQLLLRGESTWTATGFDTPKVAEIATAQAARLGVGDRFDCEAVDFLAEDWGPPRDLVLLVNVCHLLPRHLVSELIARAAKAVRPGGCVCVVDHMHLDTKDEFDEPQDRFAALFAVSMLSTGGGDTHRVSDYRHWLTDAGLRPAVLRPTPMHRLLLAVAPGERVD